MPGSEVHHYVRLKWMIGITGALFALGALVFSTLSLWNHYHTIRNSTGEHAQAVALALEEHTQRVIRDIDAALLGIAESRPQQPASEPVTWPEATERWANRLPQVRFWLITDAEGTIIHSSPSSNALGVSVADHQYFGIHQDGQDGLLIQGPLRAKETGRWFISLSRRLSTTEGAFAGVAVAVVRPDYFLELYQAVQLGENGSMSLFHKNGTLLAQLPDGDRLIGRSFAQAPLFNHYLKQSPIGVTSPPETTDGVSRLLAHRALSDLPFVITVGIDEDWALASWRKTLVQFLAIIALFICALGYLLVLLFRQLNRLQSIQYQLAIREEHFRLLAQSASDAVITLNADGLIHSWNQGAEKMFGEREEAALGTAFDRFIPVAYRDAHRAGIDRLKHNANSDLLGKTLEFTALHHNGQEFPVEICLSSWNQLGKTFYTGILRDISARREYEAHIRNLASHDPLTGLPNRTLFLDRLQMAMATALRAPHKLAVIFIDLDEFKPINDTHGHLVGDQVLQQVSIRLTCAVRDSDTVARLGGDEFLILLSQVNQNQDASRVCQALLESLTTPIEVDGLRLPLSCSMGVAIFPDDAQDAESLIEKADDLMYQVKRAGKNHYRMT